ncbi:MAG TPA: YbhB/YbcL family Raf kinase inhibitor-like protein [Bryobacteraceae bacterium]|jgi:hypothetical protein|nr:YbhB/YbcL family Raf kinase inhibitor-like protein [Bryobacteraceae bacterium]
MKITHQGLLSAVILVSAAAMAFAQAPAGGRGAGGRGRGPAAPALSVTTSAFADGSEIPAKYTFRGENKFPGFEFHWNLGPNPGTAPEALKTYAIVFHDIENSSAKTTVDTLHWSVFNIPGTASSVPEGLAAGDLPDGTRNGPGIAAGRGGGAQPAYFGPGAGPGPFHHYVFEFYALDTKIDLPANTTRDELMKAMDGHVIGKAAYVGRYHAPAAQ